MHKEYLGAIVWNPIYHDLLTYGIHLIHLLVGLIVKLSLSEGSLEFDGTAEDFPKKTCR